MKKTEIIAKLITSIFVQSQKRPMIAAICMRGLYYLDRPLLSLDMLRTPVLLVLILEEKNGLDWLKQLEIAPFAEL